MAKTGRHSPPKAAGTAALGSIAKSVGHSGSDERRREHRAARFRHQRHAGSLLPDRNRTANCRWAVARTTIGVTVHADETDRGVRAWYSGTQSCGSVWHCPLCASRISEVRRGEMNQLLAWSRRAGHRPMLMTLTARHGRDDRLADLLERMKRAKQRLHQHRSWKALKHALVGTVTATEVTAGGRNGWHPHFHVLVIVHRDATDDDMDDLAALDSAWIGALSGQGLDGNGAAFDLQDAQAAGTYVAKWGAAEEITLSGQKVGRGAESRTPMQLLADSCDDDDTRARRLWKEYAAVFQGRRQLVWSRGLKALAGIGETSDEDAADDGGTDDTELTWIPTDTWRGRDGEGGARTRRALVLDVAERTRDPAAVMRIATTWTERDPDPPDGAVVDDDDDFSMGDEQEITA